MKPVTPLGFRYNTFRKSAAPTILNLDKVKRGGVNLCTKTDLTNDLKPVINLGSGYNTFRKSAAHTILNFTVDDVKQGGVNSYANVYFCRNTKEVFRALKVDASLSVDSTWGSFKDKFEFVNNLQLNTTSIVILVSATKETELSTLEKASFKKYIQHSDAKSVYMQGGDSYVSSITKGTQFIAAYSFVSYDKETYNNLVNAAEASFKVYGSTFNANFGINITNIQQLKGVTYNFEQKGIGFTNVKFPEPDHLVEFVLNFNNINSNGPVVLSFITDSYSQIAGCPDGFEQIDSYRHAYENPYTGYAAIDLLAKNNKSLIKDISKIYDYYGCLNVDTKLTSVPAKLDEDSKNIATWLKVVSEDPTIKDIKPPVLSDGIEAGLPKVNYYLLRGDTSAGGTGGEGFVDVRKNDILNGILPTEIKLKGGKVLDSIETTYTFADGRPAVSFKHGRDGGKAPDTIQIQQGEYITKVTAKHGDLVNQVTIMTHEQFIVGPKDPKNASHEDTLWDSDKKEYSRFVGWSGSSGKYIDQLRALYVKFSAATWKKSDFSS
jgi:hypothetical protein